jgi:uncharacterized protein YcaQ
MGRRPSADAGCRDVALEVDRRTACRFLIRRSGLGRLSGEARRWPGPGDLPAAGTVAAVKALEYVQVDPMSVLRRNHELVLAARVKGFTPEILGSLLYRERALIEVTAFDRCIVPAADYGLFQLNCRLLERRHRPDLAELAPVMREVLARIEAEGPLSSLDFAGEHRIRGWWDLGEEATTKAARQALEWLWHFGRVVIRRREGLRRYFDLPERVWGEAREAGGRSLGAASGLVGPAVAGMPALEAWDAELTGDPGDPAEERRVYREGVTRKYCRAMGLSNPRAFHFGWDRDPIAKREALAAALVASGDLLPVRIEGLETTYYVPVGEAADLASAATWAPRPEVSFLPPLDNLIWDRRRLADLWRFDYVWEAYIPPAKRRYGPYTCVILWGDAIAGRIEAKMERAGSRKVQPTKAGCSADEGTLIVGGLWWEKRIPAGPFLRALQAWAIANGASDVADPNGVLPQAKGGPRRRPAQALPPEPR